MSSSAILDVSIPKSTLKETQYPDNSEPATILDPLPASIHLHDLKLAPHMELEQAQQRGRLKCSSCGGSRMFFCYTCCCLVGVRQQEIPSVKLPIKIDIIKHPSEVDGKSTAIHAKILSPEYVTIYTYPCIPEYENETDKVVLVFPGPESVSVEEMTQILQNTAATKATDSPPEEPPHKRPRAKEMPEGTQHAEGQTSGAKHTGGGAEAGKEGQIETPEPSLLQRVVFIDSTWNQTNRIITDERLQALLRVELKTRKTCFWRHQKGSPDTYLATIEAVYYFLKDYHELCLRQEYTGQYDNLLYFYTFLHTLINKAKTTAGKGERDPREKKETTERRQREGGMV
ncbi:DTW domain-containing protein 1 [Esox lucius]|uniref:tRNA-uridine aminocarboxypropyltransferase 1 n=1 Tax=Esox lucius TaxID=8010 RepID=A0A3P8XI56_ESOLU|nr:DTW domain-containing protein 1 [Esox lucius]XP_019909369.2 DTW domain-containing protein 1 [Esox lucius]